jgi:hypothetical protein
MSNQESTEPEKESFPDDDRQLLEDSAREAVAGEADEPNAPTAAEENEGMNTVLGAGPITGVQDNASDE